MRRLGPATLLLAVCWSAACADGTGKASLDSDVSTSTRPQDSTDTDPPDTDTELPDTDPSDTDELGDTDGDSDTDASDTDAYDTATDTGAPLADGDLDGFTAADGDCDDSDPTIHPAASDNACDGVDRDCDGFDHVGHYQHWIYDWMDDGAPDAEQRIFNSRTHLWAVYDEGLDGTYEQVAEGLYDANGLLIEYTVDLWDDGTIDYVLEQDRDPSGTILTQREDLENDGVWDNELFYDYDVNGHLVEVEAYEGGASYTLTFTNDAQGRAQTVVYDDGSMTLDGTYTWAGDLVTRFEWALTGVGSIYVETWTYDAQGNELSYELDDFVADGVIDYRETRTWHPSGVQESLAVDADGDGTPESVETHLVAVDGSLTGWTVDAPYDGMVDHRAAITDQCTDTSLLVGEAP